MPIVEQHQKIWPEQMMMISAGTSNLLVPAEIIIICSGKVFLIRPERSSEVMQGSLTYLSEKGLRPFRVAQAPGHTSCALLAEHLFLQILLGRVIAEPDAEQGLFELKPLDGGDEVIVFVNPHTLAWYIHIIVGSAVG